MKKININSVYFCNTPGLRIDSVWVKAKNNNFDYFVFNEKLYCVRLHGGVVDEPYEFDYGYTQNMEKRSQIENINIRDVYWFNLSDGNLDVLITNKFIINKYKYIFVNGIVYKIIIDGLSSGFISAITLKKLEKSSYIINIGEIQNYV